MAKPIRLNLEDLVHNGIPSGWPDLARVLSYPILGLGMLGAPACASPTAPTPPGNGGGGNPPPTQTNYTATGKFLNPSSNAGYSGTLMFGNTPGTVQSGDWTVEKINPGQGIMVVFPENGGNLERRTRRNAMAGPNDYGEIYGFPNDSNILTIFDATGRPRSRTWRGEGPSVPDGTTKWAEEENGQKLPPPTIHVDDSTVLPILSVRGTERQTRYTEVLNRTLSEYIPQAYSYFHGGQVIRHPTSATLPADGTPRALIIRSEPQPPGVGAGGFLNVYINRQNYIYSCTYVIFPNVAGDGIVQDGIQCASGLWSNNTANQQAVRSFYNHNANRPEPEDGLPLVDIILGQIQRKMRVGTKSPWDDSHLSALDPISVTGVATSLRQDGEVNYNPPQGSNSGQPAEDPREPPQGKRMPKDYLFRERLPEKFNPSIFFVRPPYRR